MLRLFLFVILLSPSIALSEDTWLTASVLSYHFDRKEKYNETNFGLGFEQTLNDNWRLVAGTFRNSQRIDSTYMGVVWNPLHFGRWHFGALVGQFTGYEIDALYGVLPVATYEHNKWGVNFALAPPAGNNDSAVLGIQIKWKLK